MKFTLSTLTQLVKDKPEITANRPYGAPSQKLINRALKYSRVFINPVTGKPVGIPAVLMLKWLKLVKSDFKTETNFVWGESSYAIAIHPKGGMIRFKVFAHFIPAPEIIADQSNPQGQPYGGACKEIVVIEQFPLSKTPDGLI